jgi:transcriptional regulator with XRE-family HTH domain
LRSVTWRYNVRDSSVTSSLRDLRTICGLSLRDVQDRTLPPGENAKPRIWAAHLSEIERGKRVPTPEQLVILSRIYGVSTEGWTLMYVHVDGNG